MRFGVLGTGQVGRTLADKLIALGDEVCLGSRTADNEAATAWAAGAGDRASHGTFSDAARFGELVLNCTPGQHSVAIVAGVADQLAGKVLLDLANPLDFSGGFPPRLSVCNDDSLGEQIQRAAPAVRVVKSLNTVAASVMVEPARVPGEHDVFVCGDDDGAKAAVAGLLARFGWSAPVDLGGIEMSRGVEMWLPLWVRLYGSLGTDAFNLKIVRAT